MTILVAGQVTTCSLLISASIRYPEGEATTVCTSMQMIRSMVAPGSTDPAASWANRGGPSFFAYSTNYLIDLKAGIIVDVEAAAVSKAAEVMATRKMIERVEDKFDLKPERLVGDTNYGSVALLGWPKSVVAENATSKQRTDSTLYRD